MKNLLFQADFSAWNLSVPLNYFFWPEFEDVLRWRSLTIPFFYLLINLRLVLQFDHILSAQTQTSIFSSLLFQKNRQKPFQPRPEYHSSTQNIQFYSKRVVEHVWDVQFSKYPWLINLSTWSARSSRDCSQSTLSTTSVFCICKGRNKDSVLRSY